jgi:hypothetical protein
MAGKYHALLRRSRFPLARIRYLFRPTQFDAFLVQAALTTTARKSVRFSILKFTDQPETAESEIRSIMSQSYTEFELWVAIRPMHQALQTRLSEQFKGDIAAGRLRFMAAAESALQTVRDSWRLFNNDFFAYQKSGDSWDPHYLLMTAAGHFYQCRARSSLCLGKPRASYNLSSFTHHRTLAESFSELVCGAHAPAEKELIDRLCSLYQCHIVRRNLVHKAAGLTGDHAFSRPKKYRHLARPLISIKCPAPIAFYASEWGDYHLARMVEKAVKSIGYATTIDFMCDKSHPSTLCNFVMNGTHTQQFDSKVKNVIWVYSHPENLSADQLSQFDYVLVASKKLEREYRASLGKLVIYLPQFSDPESFYHEPSPERTEQLLFIGNSRHVFREVVKACTENGLPLAVYGADWEKFIDPQYIKGTLVSNKMLHEHYASALITLNDHWESMRRDGFPSNRIYDVALSGGFIISDAVAELDPLLAEALVTYDGAEDLLEKIKLYSGDAEARAKKSLELTQVVEKNFSLAAITPILKTVLTALVKSRPS